MVLKLRLNAAFINFIEDEEIRQMRSPGTPQNKKERMEWTERGEGKAGK